MKFKQIFSILLILTISQIATYPAHAWNVDSSEDEFGSKIYMLSLYYVSGYGQIEDKYENPDTTSQLLSLTIRCKDRNLEIYTIGIIPESNYLKLFSPKQKRVDVKFNQGTVSSWPVQAQPAGIFYLNEKAFINKLFKSKSFAVRIATPTGISLAATFKLDNLSSFRGSLTKAGCRV